jgi:hypothetical protein
MIRNFQKETNIISQRLYLNICNKTHNLGGNHKYLWICKWDDLHEMTKITISNQFHKSKGKYKSENGRTGPPNTSEVGSGAMEK